jgi:hypothetical protein
MTGQPAFPADGAVRITIVPDSDYYAEDDPRRASETFELSRALEREFRDELTSLPAPGTKGGILEMVVTLGSAGAITALVEVFKAWLATRPVHRTVRVTYALDQPAPGGAAPTGTLEIDATNVDSAALAIIAGEALKRGS